MKPLQQRRSCHSPNRALECHVAPKRLAAHNEVWATTCNAKLHASDSKSEVHGGLGVPSPSCPDVRPKALITVSEDKSV